MGDKITQDQVTLFGHYFNEMARNVYANALAKGWWDGGNRNKGELIALMHSELSEALEALRNGDPESEKTPGHSQVAEELADAVIRIMDYASAFNLDLGRAIVDKAAYNTTRPHRHGGKRF